MTHLQHAKYPENNVSLVSHIGDTGGWARDAIQSQVSNPKLFVRFPGLREDCEEVRGFKIKIKKVVPR